MYLSICMKAQGKTKTLNSQFLYALQYHLEIKGQKIHFQATTLLKFSSRLQKKSCKSSSTFLYHLSQKHMCQTLFNILPVASLSNTLFHISKCVDRRSKYFVLIFTFQSELKDVTEMELPMLS